MAYKVVIATRSFGSSSERPQQILAEAGCELIKVDINKATDAEYTAALQAADAAIVGSRPITAAMISATHKLRVICMHGVGVDHIDRDAARAKGVIVANCPGANADGVADLTLGLMLAAARRIPYYMQALLRGEWGHAVGVEIWQKTLGLIGLGRIGRGVAERAAGFQMRVLVYDPYLSPDAIVEIGAEPADLDRVFAEADFLSLHAPATPETRRLINRDTLRKMKSTAYLINTARGDLVDEQALYEALTTGVIAGAALDVYNTEPPGDNPLLTLPNVVATPHIGAHSREATTNASVMAAQNVAHVLQTGDVLWKAEAS
jgi:D-3-phosphoglycerate dehydrogenase